MEIEEINIIGCGRVGSEVAYTLSMMDNVKKIKIIDRNKEKAETECFDINDGEYIREKKIKTFVSDYEEIGKKSIVILAVGRSELLKDGNRFNELEYNIPIVNEISKRLNDIKFCGLLINITNPCDTIASLISKKLNKGTVIGTGTILDSARYSIEAGNDTNVYGIHGGVGIYQGSPDKNLDEDVVSRYKYIVEKKKCTTYGISSAVKKIVDAIGEKEPLNISYRYKDDIYLSVPCCIEEDYRIVRSNLGDELKAKIEKMIEKNGENIDGKI